MVNLENENHTEYRKVQGILGETSFLMVIPKNYAVDLGISKGDFVKVYLAGHKIVVEKA